MKMNMNSDLIFITNEKSGAATKVRRQEITQNSEEVKGMKA